jgi:GxxExxY protein
MIGDQGGADGLLEAELTGHLVSAFFHVYNKLGPGFLESVYRRALAHELRKRGLHVESEAPLDVFYDGVRVGHFRADLVVDRRVVVELKAHKALVDEDVAQLVNALQASGREVGVLLNFGPKPMVRRFVNSTRRARLAAPEAVNAETRGNARKQR